MNKQYYKQVALLLKCLPWVAKEKNFVLKGGTAINLLIRTDFPRLSVDIDLTYVKVQDREQSLSGIESGLLAIKESLESKIPNIHVLPTVNKKLNITTKLEIQHESVSIKIEPNLIIRGTVFPTQTLDVAKAVEEQFNLAVTDIPVASVADIYGGKICAALDRQHPRDLFDIEYIIKNKISNELKQAFLFYLISSNRPTHELLNPNRLNIESAYKNEFIGMSNINVSLEKLYDNREQLIELINKSLDEQDKQFLMSVNECNPKFELFTIKDIENLPSIKWKLYNLKQMDKTKRVNHLKKLEKILYGL